MPIVKSNQLNVGPTAITFQQSNSAIGNSLFCNVQLTNFNWNQWFFKPWTHPN